MELSKSDRARLQTAVYILKKNLCKSPEEFQDTIRAAYQLNAKIGTVALIRYLLLKQGPVFKMLDGIQMDPIDGLLTGLRTWILFRHKYAQIHIRAYYLRYMRDTRVPEVLRGYLEIDNYRGNCEGGDWVEMQILALLEFGNVKQISFGCIVVDEFVALLGSCDEVKKVWGDGITCVSPIVDESMEAMEVVGRDVADDLLARGGGAGPRLDRHASGKCTHEIVE